MRSKMYTVEYGYKGQRRGERYRVCLPVTILLNYDRGTMWTAAKKYLAAKKPDAFLKAVWANKED